MAHSEFDDLVADMVLLRRDIHSHPELGFEEMRTAALIAARLRAAGIEVHEGVGGTGVVGVLRNGDSARSIGLRADMDALPVQEETGLPYASRHDGIFHGCGHDGHVAMLLGAALHLARTRRFNGTVNFIFQPAEEGLAGGRAMVEDGLFRRFPCDRVVALHNWPELPLGTVATCPGPIMAAADRFEIALVGRGGHAAMPYDTPDAIMAAGVLIAQLNSIISRDVNPTASAVLSITQVHGGHAHNVIPARVTLGGTVRSFDADVQHVIETRLREMVAGTAQSFGLDFEIHYDRYYPATINDEDAAAEVFSAAASIGADIASARPAFTSEDFAFMLQACKGAYIWLGQAGEGAGAPLHNPRFDFNDDALPIGVHLHVALVDAWLGFGYPT